MEVKRYWVDGDLHPITSKDKQPHDVVLAADFDRILAERDALQSRLNSVKDENIRMWACLSMMAADPGGSIRHYTNSIDRVLEKNS